MNLVFMRAFLKGVNESYSHGREKSDAMKCTVRCVTVRRRGQETFTDDGSFCSRSVHRTMAESYDVSSNPSHLLKSHGTTSVRAGASRQYFLTFDDNGSQLQEDARRQLCADSWQPSSR